MWVDAVKVSKQALSNRLRNVPAYLFANMFEQVIERRRWRIEDAFLLTKRLLGLAYLLVGGSNGVQIQIYAAWIFYTVLIDLSSEVAVALSQPLERISVEMVFRSLFHFSRARATEIVPFLVEHARSFGLIKAQRKRHRYIKS